MSRVSSAITERLVGGVSRAGLVGPYWTRVITRKDVNGTALTGLILEPTLIQNKFWQSRDPDTTWDKIALASVTANGKPGWELIADYADGLVATAVNTQHGFSDSIELTAEEWSIWAIVEVGDQNWLKVFVSTISNAYGYFYLPTASKGTMGTAVNEAWCVPLGGGRVLCGIRVTGTAAYHTCGFYTAYDDEDDDFSGDSSTVNTWISDMQAEPGLFPSTLIESGVGTGTRYADSDLDYDLGTSLSEGTGSFDFKILTRPHTPTSVVDLVHLTEDGSNYLKVQLNTSGYAQVAAAKVGGDAGLVVVPQTVCDGQIWKIEGGFTDGYLALKVINVKTLAEFTGQDLLVSIPTGMSALEFKPTGVVIGEWHLYDNVAEVSVVSPVDNATGVHKSTPISFLVEGVDDLSQLSVWVRSHQVVEGGEVVDDMWDLTFEETDVGFVVALEPLRPAYYRDYELVSARVEVVDASAQWSFRAAGWRSMYTALFEGLRKTDEAE